MTPPPRPRPMSKGNELNINNRTAPGRKNYNDIFILKKKGENTTHSLRLNVTYLVGANTWEAWCTGLSGADVHSIRAL